MSLRGDVTLFRNYGGAPSPITIAGNVTVYSRIMRLNYGQAFGIALKAASSGVIALQIQLEQSDVSLTEAEEGLTNANYVVGDNVPDIVPALANSTKRIILVAPVPMKYCRLKIIGGALNDASTTLTANLFQQEFVC